MLVPVPRASRRLTIVLVFAVHGLVQGGLFTRLAEIQRAAALVESELGVAMVGGPAGVLFGALLISPWIERRGTRAALLAGLPLYAAGPVLAALATGVASLFGAMFLFGLGLMIANVAMNVESDRVEAATGRRLINRCHGTWSLGFLAASLVGTGAIAVGIPPVVHLAAMLVLLAGVTLAVAGPMQPSPPRASARGGPVRRFALPTLPVLLILGFALSGQLLETSARDWSVISVRDVFGVEDWVAALALPSFIAAQTLGRFLADHWIDRHGPLPVALVLCVISLAGLAMIAAGWAVALTLAGFALVGLGISTAFPQAYSAAARLGDRPASENVAALATMQTVIGFAFPPLFGLIATDHGIQLSFAALLPLPVLAIAFARRTLAGGQALGPRSNSAM